MLLVEDSPDAAEMMAAALEMLGCHVAVAHDGLAALAAVATDCPDVGLLDIGLPGMSRYQLAAKLRAGGFCHPSLKLVAVTGYAKDPEALAAAGFDGHLQWILSNWEKRSPTSLRLGVNRHACDTSRTPAFVCRADGSLQFSNTASLRPDAGAKHRDPR